MLHTKDRRRTYRYWLFVMLALLLGAGISTGVAFAGIAASPVANPPMQGKTDPAQPEKVLGGTATPCPTQVPLSEGFETGTLGAFNNSVIITSTTTPVPTPGWASVAANPHSGARSAFAPNPDRTTDSRLTTINGIIVPAGVTTATLTFWHRFAFENLFDGGVLEVSTNNGTSWADADANIQQGGYNGTITVFQGCVTAGTPPPFPSGKRVWTGSQTTYGQVVVNLLPYAGNTIKFRFRLGTDCSVSNTGWNVDDVQVMIGTVCPTSTPSPTPTPCPIQFSDVPISNTFYQSVRCLACRGIISGYADGTFRPNNPVTRGQLAKMVSNSAGFAEPHPGQTFEDVPPTNTFHVWIERLSTRGFMSGYTCGGLGEPCITGKPYFRPNANATRGQTSKIVSNTAGFSEPPSGQTFEDVPLSYTFYNEIERLAVRGIMSGYVCGGPGEPCIEPENRPYFRPGNDVTRGQSSKIVAGAFYPGCVTP